MSETFLNPYNFIPLPDEKSTHYEDTDVHTGVVTYTITTKSPLFIPNTSSEHAFALKAENGKDHKSYDFYSYTELEEGKNYRNFYADPVIPGSELRGMIRGIYETLTGSCMGVLNEGIYPVKRSSEVFKAALIRKEKGLNAKLWLVEAEDCIYRKSQNWNDKLFLKEKKKEGQKVFFRKLDRERGKALITDCSEKKDPSHPDCGYLIKGMTGPENRDRKKEKHNCHVFIARNNRVLKEKLSGDDIERLKKVIDSYREQPTAAEDSYEEYLENLKIFLKQEEEGYFPVYYSIIKENGQTLLYLSPASITKEISNHSIGELAGALKPCRNKIDEKTGRIDRCPACDLFGVAGETNEESSASLIRFADAYVLEKIEPQKYYDPIITLETLGGPKLSNTEFYLEKKEGADFWTYDYYTMGGKAYPYRAILRGRKYYWHQPGKTLLKGIERTELNKTVRPVKSGVTFEGKLYFNRISNRQLNQLLWILNGGNLEEQPLKGPIAYKLGGGKPLGLGSVELKVKDCSERRFFEKNGEIHYFNGSDADRKIPCYEEAGFLSGCKADFLTICALHAAEKKNVSYPIVPEQHGVPMTEGYKWFVQNHASKGGRMPNARIQMQTLCTLPKIQGVETIPEEPKRSAMAQTQYPDRQSNQTKKRSGHSQSLKKKKSRHSL